MINQFDLQTAHEWQCFAHKININVPDVPEFQGAGEYDINSLYNSF